MGLHVITSYFNPCGYQRRRDNFYAFREGLRRQGIPCLTVQNAFGDDPFDLPEGKDIINVRTASVLWQKERLLNLAAQWLPRRADAVAWVDCDVLFDNPKWGTLCERALDRFPVVQTWTHADRLNEAGHSVGDVSASFAQVMRHHPETLIGRRYDTHGHTGYAWAMRRELFDTVGLFEDAVSGSADHFMAHAIYGDYCSRCIQDAIGQSPAQMHSLKTWGERFYAATQGQLGVVDTTLRHLWHGDLKHRRYFLRMHDLINLGFNPYTDIVAPPGRPLEWSDWAKQTKPLLMQYFRAYFESRHEDGVPHEVQVA